MRWPRSVVVFSLVTSWLLLSTAVSCKTEPTSSSSLPIVGTPWFEDVTVRVGLEFVHDPGPVGTYFFPQIMGSGGAVLDFDNDGRLDLLLLHNAGPQSASRFQLFRQNEEGRFVDVSAGSGLDVTGYGMGVAVGDVNNDGRVDVCITEYGRTRLFLNLGSGRFQEITESAGIDNPLWGTSAAFVDYNRDGWLDLVVGNFVLYDRSVQCRSPRGRLAFCHPSTFPGSVAKLFRNRGVDASGQVAFEDVTVTSGLAKAPGPALGVLCADFDGDSWVDIFIANDSKPNHLWINRRDGTFSEEAVPRGVAVNRMGQTEANMGIGIGDVDGDGLFDLFVTHLTEETHTLWKQGPRGLFQDRTVSAGFAAPLWRGTGFGTVLADFDHDGALDAAVVNGRVSEPRTAFGPETESDFWAVYKERNQMFRNDGSGRFQDVSLANPAFCDVPGVYRGLICADLDNDGALDLITTCIGGPVRVYRNTAPSRGHWLGVRAYDPKLRRDALGAEIVLEVNGRPMKRWANPAYSYLCSNDPRAHFGLGSVDRVERILVVWPDGTQEFFPCGLVNRYVELRKGEGQPP
ncbi:MAG: CRTAC1 family protein [Gemmatales bacterium]|nr:CRTAC1 family protein [Gemmatales bacterium]MDW8387399.1 CRTAC1 family protein [Gemmatales bacterium]